MKSYLNKSITKFSHINAIAAAKTKDKPSQTAAFIVGSLLKNISAVPQFYMHGKKLAELDAELHVERGGKS